MNPEQIKQEQERVLALLEGTTESEWDYAINEDTDECEVTYERDGVTYTACSRIYRPANARLMAESQRLARAHLTLLDAHLALHAQLAQAEGREAQTEVREYCGRYASRHGEPMRILLRGKDSWGESVVVFEMAAKTLGFCGEATFNQMTRAALAQAGEG